MKIDVELSLITNLIINSFVLYLTACFFKEKAKLIFLTSLIGSIIALLVPALSLASYAKILVQVFLSILMVSISFPYKKFKTFISKYIFFLGMTFLFGGGCYALSLSIGSLPIVIVLLVCFVIFMCAKYIIHQKNKQKVIDNFSFKVKIFSGDKVIEEEGFLDSGNLLYDPITKKPVILISYDVFSKLYENVNYLNAFMKKIDLKNFKNGHYIKLNTVASGTQILVFSVNNVLLEGQGVNKKYEDIMLGLSFSGFEKAFGKKILLHGSLI